MAIYRFGSDCGVKFASDHIELRGYMPEHGFGGPPRTGFLANGISVTKETYDRLLAELEANEADSADGGWNPASDPPDSNRDVWAVVRSSDGTRTVCEVYCVDKRRWWHGPAPTGCAVEDYGGVVECWKDGLVPPLPPEPPKKPGQIWRGPGWYLVLGGSTPRFVTRSSSKKYPLRGLEGQAWYLNDVTRLVRLATDEELRHVCTHGTEPDSRPESVSQEECE